MAAEHRQLHENVPLASNSSRVALTPTNTVGSSVKLKKNANYWDAENTVRMSENCSLFFNEVISNLYAGGCFARRRNINFC
jgi:hypothetical protein